MPALLGYILLAGRTLLLGFERPAFKALSQNRSAMASTAIAYSLALLVLFALLGSPLAHTAASPTPFATFHQWWPYAICSGIVAVAGYTLYTRALSIGEVSIVSPIYSTGLIWLYVLDVFFGSAHWGWRPILGVLLVSIGIALLGGLKTSSLTPQGMLRVARQPGALIMFFCALALAITRVIDSNATGMAPEVPYAIFATAPTVLFCLGYLLFKREFGSLSALLRSRPLQSVGAAACHIGGYLLLLGCLRFFSASVVEPVSQSSLLLSIGAGALFFHEDVRNRWVPALLTIAGSALLLWK